MALTDKLFEYNLRAGDNLSLPVMVTPVVPWNRRDNII